MLVILSWRPINTQPLSHDKSMSTWQFIKSNSRHLQKLLKYLSGVVTSMFKDGTGGCACWFAFPVFLGCGGYSGVSLTIFFKTQMIYHLKRYHQLYRFCLYDNFSKFLTS